MHERSLNKIINDFLLNLSLNLEAYKKHVLFKNIARLKVINVIAFT